MIDGLKPYGGYKLSGLSWVKDIPTHWRTERAKWLFKLSTLPVRPEHDIVTCFRDGQVTLRRNRRTRGFTMAVLEGGYQGILPGQLVVHAMDGFAGAIGVSDSEGKCTPEYSVLDARSRIVDVYFYAYLLREMARLDFIRISCPAVRQRAPRVRWMNLKEMTLPVPPPEEQAAIVRFLDHADRRIRRYIRAKRQLISLLNEQKQAIIHRAVTRGLDPHVKLKHSGVEWLGDVPEHWEVILNQRIFKENIRPHEGVSETPLSLSQIDGLIATDDMKERSLKTSTYENWKVTVPGDLVVNRFKAHLGVFFASTLRGIVSFHYGVFEPRRQLVTKYFEHLFHTPPYRAIYAGRSNGMTVGLQNLSNQNFYNVRTVVPPPAEQRAIVAFLTEATSHCDRAINDIRKEISLFSEFHTRLIADVVSGKIDVRNAVASLPSELDAAEPDAEEPFDEDETTDDAELDTEPEEIEP